MAQQTISKTETVQTAVDWLWNQLCDKGYFKRLPISEIKQAKAMEKEQIMNAYIEGELQQGFEAEAEQYYNQTYGSNNQI